MILSPSLFLFLGIYVKQDRSTGTCESTFRNVLVRCLHSRTLKPTASGVSGLGKRKKRGKKGKGVDDPSIHLVSSGIWGEMEFGSGVGGHLIYARQMRLWARGSGYPPNVSSGGGGGARQEASVLNASHLFSRAAFCKFLLFRCVPFGSGSYVVVRKTSLTKRGGAENVGGGSVRGGQIVFHG